jgi:S1-C subfamily serine protease
MVFGLKNMIEKNTSQPEEKIIYSKPKSGHKFFFVAIIILTIILSSFFGLIFGFIGGKISDTVFSKIFPKLRNESSEKKEISLQRIVEEDSAIIDVVEKNSPAVVSIIVTKDVPKFRSFFDDPFGFFNQQMEDRGGQTEKQKIGGGSGFLVSEEGMIVTNRHVVQDSNAEYTVITNDGKEHPAKIMARDPIKDIAIIKIEGKNFPILEFGNSENLKIGQTVIAIGNSLGEFSNSVSKGIISGLGRSVTAGSGFGKTEQLSNIIQTDAAINPGNSGGPLLDINGKVIGVNVAMAQGAENIAFSIPIGQVEKIVKQVKSNGKISSPFLGIRSIAIDAEIKEENNLPFEYGALIARGEKITDFAVIPGSPADKAGLLENDIILEVNGKKIDSKNQITEAISQFNVGEEIVLKIWRKGETKEVKVKLEERK